MAESHLVPASVSTDLSDLGSARIPILARLADYDEKLLAAEKLNATLSLWDYVVAEVSRRAGDVEMLIADTLAEAGRNGDLLIALDGMDELRDVGRRRLVRNAVTALNEHLSELTKPCFLGGAKPNFLVVTSRHAGYREVALPPSRFSHAVVQSLSDARRPALLVQLELCDS